MRKFFQFMIWPSVAGVLFGVIVVQLLQIRQLTGLLAEQIDASQVPVVQYRPISYAEAIEKAAASVVSIDSKITLQKQFPPSLENYPPNVRRFFESLPEEFTRTSIGSGVVVSKEGHILTSLHVIQGSQDIYVGFGFATSNPPIPAQLIGVDPETDLALLKIDAHLAPPMVPIGSSENVQVGDPVLAIGFPSQLPISKRSISAGIVSGLGLPIPIQNAPIIEYIQTDAAIGPGNSGGALIDAQGNLIGINSFIASESGSWEGIAFAVPVNKAMFVMDRLIRYGEVISGYIGVRTEPELLTPRLRQEFFGSQDIQGLLIAQIDEASPAEFAGLQAGDVMVAIDAVQITSTANAISQISQKMPGENVQIRIYRQGEYKEFDVEIVKGKPSIISIEQQQ